jgi:hypothetical protein
MKTRNLLVAVLLIIASTNCVGNAPATTQTTSGTKSSGVSAVKQFTAQSATSKVNLNWQNPAESIKAIRVLRKTGAYSSHATDGTTVYEGTATSAADTSTTNYTEYYYTAYAISPSDVVSDPANDKSASCPATLTCPTGYVLAPADKANGIYCQFCIAAYEMRNVSSVATSQASGAAWSMSGQNVAKTNCTSLGTGYHLMTNAERLTIAKDIESVASNWTGGTVGSGSISKGYQASTSYGDSWTNTSDASSSLATCLYNTAANTCASTGNALYRRTLTMSNGSVIWDFIGNKAEWVDWTENVSNVPIALSGSCDTNGTGCEFSNTVAGTTTPQSMWKPTSGYNSTKGFGLYFKTAGAATSLGALNGGYWDKGGLYNLEFIDAAFVGPQSGFRCAYTQ